MRWIAALVALTAVCSRIADAQVIRGVVIERVSGQPLRGVLVSVSSVPDSLRPGGIRHTLTNVRGEYAMTLARPGTYVVSAKRIGAARFSSAPFSLATSETRRMDITLAALESRLPVVKVSVSTLCIPKPDQLGTFVALWDEARTALLASEVTRDEHLVSGWLSRYVRSLEPRSLRILQDQRSVAEGRFDRPIRSISGDSLARVGFWRKQDKDTMVFHGPDAEALLSDAFKQGHCFEVVQGSGSRRGFLGIAFRPRTNRITGGIAGTLWLDAGNFELRFVEFRYTNLITVPSNPHLGGEVHFLRLESGAWLVRRWLVRMPQFADVRPVSMMRAGNTASDRKAYVYRIIEEGGALFTPGLRSWETPGTISGTVMDSTGGKPLTGALVSLSGTPYSAEVDSAGRFRFDSIPPGAYTLLASQRAYADLGQLADDEPLNLSAGQTYRANLRAIGTAELLAILCDGKKVTPPLATLRVQATHADSGGPLPRLMLWLRWPDPEQKEPDVLITPEVERKLLGIQSMTDEVGAATFCGVPAGAKLELVMPRVDDDPEVPQGARFVRVTGFVLTPGEIASRTISVRPPK